MKAILLIFSLILISTFSLNAQTVMNIYQSDGTVLQIPLNNIDSITYTITNPGNLATISTMPIGNITSTSANSGGDIISNGGTPITQRGIVWSTSPSPTTANNSTSNGSGTGSFTSNLNNLTTSTTYYVRAYATNSAGTAYGNELSFTTDGGSIFNPDLTYGSITDQDGNIYATIVIGTQEWMAENLRTTTYANGDPIPNITDNTEWFYPTSGAWSHYENDSQYENPYGKFYNWYAVGDSRNVCPTGWHVPTDAEWNILIGYLDPSFDPNFGGAQSGIAGGKMKSTGTQYWISPNAYATNESGFSGLPGGARDNGGGFYGIGLNGFWWSASEVSSSSAWYRLLYNDNGDVYRSDALKENGFYVRCLRD